MSDEGPVVRELSESLASEPAIYGEGFAAVYTTSRYAVFSRRMAKLALLLIERHAPAGRELLDLACGAGAGSLSFAKAGYQVSGVDASSVMIRNAEELAARHGFAWELSVQDMRLFTLPHRVDIVTCLFDALNYMLNEQDLAAVFDRVSHALGPDGVFIFDMNTPHGLATRWGTKDVVATNRADIFEVNQNRYDSETRINTTTTTVFVRDNALGSFQRHTEVHRERGYPLSTIVTLLRKAALEPIAVHGLDDMYQGLTQGLGLPADDTGRIIIVARPHR